MTTAPSAPTTTTKVIVESKTSERIALIEEFIENVIKVEFEVCIEVRVFAIEVACTEERIVVEVEVMEILVRSAPRVFCSELVILLSFLWI